MTSEPAEQFVERMGRAIPYNSHLLKSVDLSRLVTLARRGAEATDRIEQLEAALQRIDRMEVYEADAAVVLWAKIGIMRDIARAALGEERT